MQPLSGAACGQRRGDPTGGLFAVEHPPSPSTEEEHHANTNAERLAVSTDTSRGEKQNGAQGETYILRNLTLFLLLRDF